MIDWRSFSQKYCKEVVVWKRTKHPNILSIEGVAPKLFEFCMVSQWMENGDMLPYLEKFPGANRLDLVNSTRWRSGLRLTDSQLIGITCGLDYLHRSDVVHGDLKGVRWIYPATHPTNIPPSPAKHPH